ncbi:MAG: FkbM family methyltransferase, partial [Flavobacteriales bacterium]|nr:FkbM family methyltransferase [Flavobacteriales bacterium]
SVPSVKLRDVLISNGTVDLLKVDIEGAETEVLLDCGDALGGVQRLYVEYHSFRNRPQRLHELLALLAAQGFRYYLHRIGAHHAQPFMALADAERWTCSLISMPSASDLKRSVRDAAARLRMRARCLTRRRLPGAALTTAWPTSNGPAAARCRPRTLPRRSSPG